MLLQHRMLRRFLQGRSLGAVVPFNSLLSEAVPLTVSNSRAGASVSPLTGLELAEDEVDQTTINGILMQFARAGYTTLTAEALTDAGWSKSANVTVSTPSAGVSRITWDGVGVGTVKFAIASAGANRLSSFSARVVSGTVGSGAASFLDAANTSLGTPLAFSALTASFATNDITVLAAETSTQVAFTGGESGTLVIDIKEFRAHSGTVRMVPAPVGSAAGTVTAPDLLSCTPTWPTAGTILSVAIPYNWVGADNPIADTCRWFSTGNTFDTIQGSAVLIRGSGGSPSINTGGSISAGMNVVTLDWNGSEIGGRRDLDFARSTSAETDRPSGALTCANIASGIRSMHAASVTLLFNRVLSDSDYAILYTGLQARLGDFAWVA